MGRRSLPVSWRQLQGQGKKGSTRCLLDHYFLLLFSVDCLERTWEISKLHNGGLGDIQEAEKECKIYWRYLRNDKLGKSYGHTSWNQWKEVFPCTAEGNVNVKEGETQHNVQIHEKYCSEEKSYVCQQCGNGFIKSGHCKQHEIIHTGVKPYVCKQCGKAFNTRANCKIHERIHTGEKPYVCKQCGKAFTQPGHCKQHESSHSR